MADIKIKTLGIPPQLIDRLLCNSITTVKDFLFMNTIELQRKTGLTLQKLNSIAQVINIAIAPKPTQASRISIPQFITFSNNLDQHLHGGIKCGHITELAGGPGLGKTQLCLQLALSNAMSGVNNKVLYIDTEGAFSTARLFEIGFKQYQLKSAENMKEILDKIYVWYPKNLQEVIDSMVSTEISIIKQKIGLLIIDSLGSLVRRQFGSEQSAERGSKLCLLSTELKHLAHSLNVAVVVTNHVTIQPRPNGEKAPLIPALGPSWSHWINSRIYLSNMNNQRRLTVMKSPDLPETTIMYRITDRGITTSDAT